MKILLSELRVFLYFRDLIYRNDVNLARTWETIGTIV